MRRAGRARAILDRLMEGDICPTPNEIRRAANAIAEKESLPSGCGLCAGSAWVYPSDPNLGVHRCTCARGQWFREKDKGRSNNPMGSVSTLSYERKEV